MMLNVAEWGTTFGEIGPAEDPAVMMTRLIQPGDDPSMEWWKAIAPLVGVVLGSLGNTARAEVVRRTHASGVTGCSRGKRRRSVWPQRSSSGQR
ncbi:hypothetical protein GTY41_31875 [Streptomyces sp. SID685]|uniref:hypothetical protein n=1 Tax=Streptomyces TaxID=1883 RepID=UPI00136D4BFB|nr:hypothetical protein [Streptomyces sp. SID685]MYR89385.1 hypothetical protein [Streptomyces sp. SID685]